MSTKAFPAIELVCSGGYPPDTYLVETSWQGKDFGLEYDNNVDWVQNPEHWNIVKPKKKGAINAC